MKHAIESLEINLKYQNDNRASFSKLFVNTSDKEVLDAIDGNIKDLELAIAILKYFDSPEENGKVLKLKEEMIKLFEKYGA